MCGIFGKLETNSCPVSIKDRDIIKQLTYAGAMRGLDSTGYFSGSYKNPHNILTYKRALPAADFICTRKFNKDLEKIATVPFFVGHNRAATKGSVNDESAHPFTYGPITLVHNGTLFTNPSGSSDFDIDSEAIAYTLSRHETLEKQISEIEKLDGAFALVWWNADTKKIYMTRNSERPLSLLHVSNKKLYFASEPLMAHWVLDRNGVDVKKIQEFPKDELWVFDLSHSDIEIEKHKLTMVEKTGYYDFTSHSYTGNYAGDYDSYDDIKWSDYKIKILKEAGFSRTDILEFTPDGFIPTHPKKPSGNNVGVTLGDIYCDGLYEGPIKTIKYRVILTGRSEQFYEKNKDSIFSCSIDNVFYSQKENNWLLTIEGKIKAIESAKTYNKNKGKSKSKKAKEEVALLQAPKPKDNTEEYVMTGGIARPRDEVETILGCGCSACDDPLKMKDLDSIVWVDDNSPVCPSCAPYFKD